MEQHQPTHNGVRPYKCDDCEKAFIRNDNLKRHKLIHISVRRYRCVFCNKSFVQSGTLEQHQLTHRGIKQFRCEYCKVRFRHKTSLKCHNLRRSDKQPYQCAFSDSSTEASDNFDNDQPTHSGFQVFCCKFCTKKFQHKNSLALHKQKHIGLKNVKRVT